MSTTATSGAGCSEPTGIEKIGAGELVGRKIDQASRQGDRIGPRGRAAIGQEYDARDLPALGFVDRLAESPGPDRSRWFRLRSAEPAFASSRRAESVAGRTRRATR